MQLDEMIKASLVPSQRDNQCVWSQDKFDEQFGKPSVAINLLKDDFEDYNRDGSPKLTLVE